ncbi:MAG: glycosyltransferase family 2 protein, partial [Acidobacteriota bacterium]
VGEGLLPETPEIARFLAVFRLERTLLAGAGTLLVGLLLIAVVAWQWWRLSFGPLDYAHTMRLVIPGTALACLGVQLMLFAFFVDILRIKHK